MFIIATNDKTLFWSKMGWTAEREDAMTFNDIIKMRKYGIKTFKSMPKNPVNWWEMMLASEQC